MGVKQLAVLGVLVGRCMIGCCSRFSGCVDDIIIIIIVYYGEAAQYTAAIKQTKIQAQTLTNAIPEVALYVFRTDGDGVLHVVQAKQPFTLAFNSLI